MKVSNLLAMCSLILSLTACNGTGIAYYAQQSPKFVLEDFFNGNLEAYGVVKDWRGRVIRKFNADILAYWNQGVGTLEEDFVFDDGEIDRRVWTLTPTEPGRYTGIAGDVVGEGKVAVAGNSAFFDYVLQIPYNDGTLDVRIDDRMYLVTPDVLINESSMSKFGIPVGEFVLVIEKTDL